MCVCVWAVVGGAGRPEDSSDRSTAAVIQTEGPEGGGAQAGPGE